MKRKLIALGLVIILILTNILSFDVLGLTAKATSSDTVENDYNNNQKDEVKNKYEGIAVDKLLKKGDQIYFKNDHISMYDRLNTFSDTAGLTCTKESLFTNQDETKKGYFECSFLIKINNSEIIKDIEDISKLKLNSTLYVSSLENGSIKTYELEPEKLNAHFNDIKDILKGFILKMHQISLKCLLQQSLVSFKSGLSTINRLSDIMEKKEGETSYSFKENIKLNLLPDYLFHPLLGKIKGGSILTFINDCDNLKYIQDIKTIEDKGKIYYEINPDYLPLLEENSRQAFLEGYNVISSTNVKNSFGSLPCSFVFRTFNADKNAEIIPKYCISYLYELAIPDNYVQSSQNKNIYVMENYNSGYQKYLCLNGIVIDVKTNNVYGYNENSEYGYLGSFADFGIDRQYVYLHTSLSSDVSFNDLKNLDDKEKKQNKISVAVYTKLYEAVWDTSIASDITAEKLKNKVITRINEKGGLYLTGRQVLFDMYYASKMPFDTVINDTIQLAEGGVNKNTYAKYFAFGPYENGEVNATKKECHYRTTADSFRFQAAFVNIKDANGATEFSGICLIRNNYYATEPSLISWLSSAAASGLPYVNAEELLNLLVANSTANDDKLTYEQFGKLAVIKEKLAHLHDNEIYSVVRIGIIVAGFIFVFYGALLLIAFWFDVLNPTNEINLLSKISFGRLRACIPDDYAYLSASTEYKYITWKQMLVRVLACFFVGLILINYEFVLSGIIYIYMTIKEIAGLE